jgi:hypothetical protein
MSDLSGGGVAAAVFAALFFAGAIVFMGFLINQLTNQGKGVAGCDTVPVFIARQVQPRGGGGGGRVAVVGAGHGGAGGAGGAYGGANAGMHDGYGGHGVVGTPTPGAASPFDAVVGGGGLLGAAGPAGSHGSQGSHGIGPAEAATAAASAAIAAGNVPDLMGNDMYARTGALGANALESASRAYAAQVAGCNGLGGGGRTASEADVAAVLALETGVHGAAPLGAVISKGNGGPKLEHLYPTAMTSVTSVAEEFVDSSKLLAYLDPEGAAKLDKALALTAVPSRFWNTPAQEQQTHARQLAAAMRASGKIDQTVEEILAPTPVWIPTAAAMRRAVSATGVDRTFQTAAVPMRFVYGDAFMGSRLQTPAVQINANTVLQEPITPGLDAYVSSQACNLCANKTTEPL